MTPSAHWRLPIHQQTQVPWMLRPLPQQVVSYKNVQVATKAAAAAAGKAGGCT
jgi:hypothetical protein